MLKGRQSMTRDTMDSVCESDPPSQFYSESNRGDFHDDEDGDQDCDSDEERGKCICTACASNDPRVNLITFLTCYLAFMALGSCLLSSVEFETEIKLKSDLIRKQEEFLNKFPSVDRASLNGLISEITRMQSRGITWEPVKEPPSADANAPNVNGIVSSNIEPFTCYKEYFEKWEKGERMIKKEAVKKEAKDAKSSDTFVKRSQELDNIGVYSGKSLSGRINDVLEHSPTLIGNEEYHLQNDVQNESTLYQNPKLYTFSTCNWDFSSSLLFMTSLVTTIGYGHVSPLTQIGKFLTIILSAVGIPFTLTLLSTTGIILLSSLGSKLESFIALFVSRIQESSSYDATTNTWTSNVRGSHHSHSKTTFLIRVLHLVFITITLTLVCFFIPAYFFHKVEPEWSYFDAVYFSYISLTTIGLGDFIPAFGMTDICSYRLLTVIYLYVGLTFVMLWLALIYRIPQFNMKYLFISSSESENQFQTSTSHCPSVSASNQRRMESIKILKKKSSKSSCNGNKLNSGHNNIDNESPSTSRSSLSKSYGTQNTP